MLKRSRSFSYSNLVHFGMMKPNLYLTMFSIISQYTVGGSLAGTKNISFNFYVEQKEADHCFNTCLGGF